VLPGSLSVPSICSKSAETFLWISITFRAFRQLALGALSAATQLCDLPVTAIGPLAAPRSSQLLQRTGVTLLAPIRQVRRVQALTAQQCADLTRPRARLCLPQDPQLVLRAKPPPLGLRDQLRVRDPRRRGAPAGPESQLAYGWLRFAAGGTVAPTVLDTQHRDVCSNLALDSSVIPRSKPSHGDVDRKGVGGGGVLAGANGQPLPCGSA
jgi:hypothetical protein